MATQTLYTFTIAQVDSQALISLINASTIITALAYINTDGPIVSIYFKDILSDTDSATLTALMSSYVYAPPIIPTGPLNVVTQYELNNKDLKLARAVGEVDSTGQVTLSMKIPGAWGTGPGRYIEGGYAISEDYNKDDYVLIWVSDDDRNIAMMIAQAQNPSATTPVPDSVIQGMGIIPGIGVAMPNYPIVKTYYDDDVQAENLTNQYAGWYFWPLAQGHNLDPVGETEVESISGYALGPSGLYLKIQYVRPTGIITGGVRINFSWARLG